MVKRTLSKKEQKNLIKQYNYNIYKIIFLLFLSVCLTSGAYAWFYHEYVSRGTHLTIGNVTALVRKYDSTGTLIDTVGDTSTLLYETNLSNSTRNSVFIEVTNDGSLDMEYYVTFMYDGTISEAGVLYYRVNEITSEVRNATITPVYDTKLKSYAAANPVPTNMATDQTNPVSNLTTITTDMRTGTIELDEDNEENNTRYYRLDYGMYNNINTSLYNDSIVSVHVNVYATQLGANLENQSEGEIWLVENEEQFRTAESNALSGDTIRLNADVNVNGSVDFQRRIHLDTNEHALTVTGDLVWDNTDVGELNIDTTGAGSIDIGGRLYVNTPRTNIHFVGENSSYDIYVAGTITLNGLQNGEEDGVLLDNVRIIKNKTGNIPADIILKSNTRINVGPNVYVGYITAEEGSTNIEVINNGSIVQLRLQDMDLLPTFTKAQIYVYNLSVIQGVVGGSAIVLPSNATPWLSANVGNTLIINSPYATEVTVSGSDNFSGENIETPASQADVIPIDGENNSYIVYIRTSTASLESLLHTYFEDSLHQTTVEANTSISNIVRLIIYTSNAQYLENEDFDYMKGNNMASLANLDISGAKVIDGTTVNRIKDNAMQNKTTLKTLILPNTVTEIGEYAFSGVPLGVISSSYSFTFLTIPASVTNIEDYAFDSSVMVEFVNFTPPTIAQHSFTFTSAGSRLFVPETQVGVYQGTTNYNPLYIHITGVLTPNKAYIIHFHGTTSVGISLVIATNVNTTVTITNSTITYNNTTYPVVCIGDNAFSHVNTPATGIDVTLPSTVTEINSYAFYNIKVNSLNIIANNGNNKSNAVEIGNYAFYHSNFRELKIDSATTVGAYAFSGNTSLVYISMNNLITLGNYAFANTDLFEIHLGTVQNIGTNVFDNVEYLQSMYFTNTNTITYYNREVIQLQTGTTLFNPDWIDNTNNRVRIYVPEGSSAANNTYLSLYRLNFEDYEDYVYVTGEIEGSFPQISINYDYGEYMVRSITYIDSLGTSYGAEIIDYHGADLTSSYQIPTSFTISGVELPVVSIGENAYKHVNTTGAVELVNNTIVSVGDYSFYSLEIETITAENLSYIGDYAFGATGLKMASFPNLYSLGDYALSDMPTLYSVNLGTVKNIGNNAVSNNTNLAQIFITSTDIVNMTISANAFANIGTSMNVGSRLRIYVPAGNTYINYYKNIFTGFETYIYPTGIIVGSYPYLPYDIGAYAIREVTIQNREGTDVTGWELIEYHGVDMGTTYSIPSSFTVDGTSHNVISIGDNAFIHATSVEGVNVTLSSNNLIKIGAYAFNGVTGITSLSSTSLLTVGEYAFNESTLNVVNIQNVRTIGSYAFANMTTLYKLDIGKVSNMGENALYNLDNLSQTFFEPTDETLQIHNQSITDVGSLTNDRIRFYVSGHEYTQTNQTISDITLTPSYEIVSIVNGPNNQIRKIYTIDVTITNPNTVDAASWEVNMNLVGTRYTGSFSSATGAEYTINNNSVQFSNLGTNGTIAANNGTVTFRVVINLGYNNTSWRPTLSNCQGTHIDIQQVTTLQNYVSIYKNLFRSEYADYFYMRGTIMGNYEQNTIPFIIGDYTINPVSLITPTNQVVSGIEFIEYHGADLNNSFILPETIDIEGIPYPIVKIGDKAFTHSRMNGSVTIDLVHNNLVHIGEHAFDGLQGIYNLEIPNVEYIGSYAFNDNKLYTVKLRDIYTLGQYSMANNPILNYIDLGNVREIDDGALYNNSNVEQIFIRTNVPTTGSSRIDIALGDNAFYNVGRTIGNRLRVYVPDGTPQGGSQTYVTLYKNTLPSSLTNYIYATGYLVGSFVYSTDLPYNIAQYSVRQITMNNVNSTAVTGWEIIEYHGDDISTSTFTLPNVNITVNVNNSNVSLPIISINDYAFYHMSFQNNYVLDLPASIINIGDYAYYKKPISQVNGANSYLVKIGKYAFSEIGNLTYIEFAGVKTVDDYAFYYCSSLATAILGTDVTYIGEKSFYYIYTTARRELYINVTSPPSTGSQPFPDRQLTSEFWGLITYYSSSFHIYVPASAVSTYQGRAPYSDYTRLGRNDNVSNIHSYSMSGGFVYNVINNNEAEIESYKADASGNVIIPGTIDGHTVTAIKATAFDTCTETTSIEIPASVNKIGNGFLSNNVTITYITVANGNTYFSAENGVLYNVNKTVLIKYPPLKTVNNGEFLNMPATVAMIATEAFANNTNLSTISLPGSIVVISHDAFSGCNGLSNITFLGNVPYVTGYGLFDAYTSGNRYIDVPTNYITNYRNYMYFREYTFS